MLARPSRRGFLLSGISALAAAELPSQGFATETSGILLLAHGTHVMGGNGHGAHGGHTALLPTPPKTNPWHDNIADIARALNTAKIPTEVAFGKPLAPHANLQRWVEARFQGLSAAG